MRRKLDRWRALPWRERWLLAELVVLLPAIGAAVRLFGVAATYRMLGKAGGRMAGRETLEPGAGVAPRRLAWLVSVAARSGAYRATCLRQSLALWWLLRRRGFPAALRIGVGRRAQELRAHAWVELRGHVVNDHPAVADDYATYHDLRDRLPDSIRMP